MKNRLDLEDITNSPTKVYGQFSFDIINRETGEVVDSYTDPNLVVEDAKPSIMKAIAGLADGHIDEIRIGDDVGEDVNLTGNPNLTFADDDPDTIFRDVGSWLDEGFLPEMSITITNTTSNDGTYTILGVTHDTITVISTDSLVAEGPVNNVNVSGTASLDNPEPPKDYYDNTTMDVVYTQTGLNANFPNERTVNFSVTITGADVMALYPSENFVEITSAALHTNDDELFAYKRFPQRSISDVLDIAVNWSIAIFDPSSLLCGSTPFALPIRTISANTSATQNDYSIMADATTASLQVTLPNAIGITGRIYNIKKIDSTSNPVTIITSASQTIDGSGSVVLVTQNESVTVQSDGTNWVIL